MPKGRRFWQHIRFLYDECKKGDLTLNDYHARLLNAFIKRIRKRHRKEPICSRRIIADPNKRSGFPRKEFLEGFYRTYGDDKYIKHEIASLRLRPKIDRLERRIRGKKADFFIYKGDIVSTISLRTGITCFAQVVDFYVDEESSYYASLIWLEPTPDNFHPEYFDGEKFNPFFRDEQLYPLDNLDFVQHRPPLEPYQKNYNIYRHIQRKYRKQLRQKLKKIAHQKERDLEASRPEVIAARKYQEFNPMWIERRERIYRNKSGFVMIKDVLKAGKQTKDVLI